MNVIHFQKALFHILSIIWVQLNSFLTQLPFTINYLFPLRFFKKLVFWAVKSWFWVNSSPRLHTRSSVSAFAFWFSISLCWINPKNISRKRFLYLRLVSFIVLQGLNSSFSSTSCLLYFLYRRPHRPNHNYFMMKVSRVRLSGIWELSLVMDLWIAILRHFSKLRISAPTGDQTPTSAFSISASRIVFPSWLS